MLCDDDAGESDVVEKQSDVDICSEDGIKTVDTYRSSRSREVEKQSDMDICREYGIKKVEIYRSSRSGECRKSLFFVAFFLFSQNYPQTVISRKSQGQNSLI